MDSLRYVMEYRIKGGRYPSLEYDIMKRLADGLLMNMGHSEKKRKIRLTEEADVAFQLFGEFLLEGKKHTHKLNCFRLHLVLFPDCMCTTSKNHNLTKKPLFLCSTFFFCHQSKSSVRRLVRNLSRISVLLSSWMSAVVLLQLSNSSRLLSL